MNIAIEGCLHGQLEEVYERLKVIQQKMQIQIDVLIMCGDFQAVRDNNDLDHVHCPIKYRQMGTFEKYYKEEQKTPFLTIFIGGNHEPVNSMRQSYFGGWVAPNIYYLGQAGCINIHKGKTSIRLCGLSGIYNHRDFQYVTKTQVLPFNSSTQISAYHLKQLDTFRVQLLGRINLMKKGPPFDIFLSHDWPQSIALYGNVEELFKYKPFLKSEVNDNSLGSPPMTRLMKICKPSYWFSAHMHIKFASLFPHQDHTYTHFLSLDKCQGNRDCLAVFHFQKGQSTQESQTVKISHDADWLSVLSLTAEFQKNYPAFYHYKNKDLICSLPELLNKIIGTYFQKLQAKTLATLSKEELQITYNKQIQLDQTKKLLQKCKIDPNIFNNLIFPVNLQPVEKQRNDEVQLQL